MLDLKAILIYDDFTANEKKRAASRTAKHENRIACFGLPYTFAFLVFVAHRDKG